MDTGPKKAILLLPMARPISANILHLLMRGRIMTLPDIFFIMMKEAGPITGDMQARQGGGCANS